MKKFPIYKITLVSLLLLVAAVKAEPQVWDLADGSTFEAEFVGIYPPDAVFKTPSGKIKKVPLDQFSEECQRRIELAAPPQLTIDFVNDRRNKNFPVGIKDKTQRPAERRCHFGVRVKSGGSGKYTHELYLEMFAIGKERNGDRYILLDKQSISFFLPENRSEVFEFRSKREVALQNYLFGEDRFGEDYFGHLIIVRDERGEEIAVKTSRDWLHENVESLRKLYPKNYFDETCTRVFPTRPKFRD